MVFRAFLEQRRSRPGRGRAHLGSLLLHVAVLLALFSWPAACGETSRSRPSNRLGRWPSRCSGHLPGLARSPGARRRPPPAANGAPASATARGVARATGPRRIRRWRARAIRRERPRLGPPRDRADGRGLGGRRTAGRRRRLRAGPAARAVRPGDRRRRRRRSPPAATAPSSRSRRPPPCAPTTTFPRLPAALWPDRGPYVVAIELCVSEQGQVSEAELLSRASARLDPVVLAAVRGWRYRPRLEGGKPSPFCHGVIIKYERHY